MRTLVLQKDLAKLKETLSMKEEAFVIDFAKLEKEFLKSKQKVESLLVENNKLVDKLKQIESDLAANKCWNRSSQALNWLNTHHSRGRKDLGFEKTHTVYAKYRKYVGLHENIVCFHCGKTGHYRYTCLSRNMSKKETWSM